MTPLLDGFSVILERPIRWGDMDAFQHVNNTVYLRYFEDARIAYFEKLDLIPYMEKTGIGPILASTSCRFRVPLTYPDTVDVGGRVVEISTDRFTMEYRVVSRRHQKIAAEGKGVLVSFDYRKGTKTDVPEEIATRIRNLDGV